MLPVGIFDGGRFFYLAILGITKKEEVAKKTFKAVTYLFLFLLLIIMVFWGIGLFK
jgi:membrane-associated protease RseP (regulator of RpoE activity)